MSNLFVIQMLRPQKYKDKRLGKRIQDKIYKSNQVKPQPAEDKRRTKE